MAIITSDPILIDGKSFVTKTDGNTATVVRIASGKAISQAEKEIAGDFYNSDLNEINYAEIFNLDFGSNYLNKLGASDEWMSTALGSKIYKNAFKKATGKDGPNLSFASIAENNLTWDSTSLNTDANGRSTTNGSGKFIGRYPLNKDRKQFDYLQVTAKKYEPARMSDPGGLTQEAEDRNMETVGSVFLPMQPGLAEGNSVSWSKSEISPIDAALANVSGAAVEGASKGIKQAGKQAMDAAKGGFENLQGVTKDEVAAFFAGQATGKNIFTRSTGKMLNPNLELIFSGPSLRQFAYTYKFTPREAGEAKMIRKIVRFFKKHMAAKREGGKEMFLKSPDVFRLKYIFKDGGQHPFLNKIKLCALQSLDVQYTPDGSYMTYDDGSMTSYQVSMQFGELNPIYNTDFEGSDDDMGF